MRNLEEDQRMEYNMLMKRGRDAERTAQLCWITGSVAGAVMLSWGIGAKNPGLMIPVVFSIALSFYSMLRARQQVRWIASYVEEFCEWKGGPQWFTRIHRLQNLPGYSPVGDWLTVCLANAGVLLSVLLAWMYAEGARRGDLMAGVTTACGVLFMFHSIAETVRLGRTDGGAMWRQVSGELREATPITRVADR